MRAAYWEKSSVSNRLRGAGKQAGHVLIEAYPEDMLDVDGDADGGNQGTVLIYDRRADALVTRRELLAIEG